MSGRLHAAEWTIKNQLIIYVVHEFLTLFSGPDFIHQNQILCELWHISDGKRREYLLPFLNICNRNSNRGMNGGGYYISPESFLKCFNVKVCLFLWSRSQAGKLKVLKAYL